MSYQANNYNFDNNNYNNNNNNYNNNNSNDDNYDDKIGHLREEVSQVTQIMRNSCEKVLERESLINNIESQSNDLNTDSLTFYRSSRKLKNKLWWKNFKFWLLIGSILIIIILIIVFSVKKWIDFIVYKVFLLLASSKKYFYYLSLK